LAGRLWCLDNTKQYKLNYVLLEKLKLFLKTSLTNQEMVKLLLIAAEVEQGGNCGSAEQLMEVLNLEWFSEIIEQPKLDDLVIMDIDSGAVPVS